MGSRSTGNNGESNGKGTDMSGGQLGLLRGLQGAGLQENYVLTPIQMA